MNKLYQLLDVIVDLNCFPGLETRLSVVLSRALPEYEEVEVADVVLRDGWTPELNKETRASKSRHSFVIETSYKQCGRLHRDGGRAAYTASNSNILPLSNDLREVSLDEKHYTHGDLVMERFKNVSNGVATYTDRYFNKYGLHRDNDLPAYEVWRQVGEQKLALSQWWYRNGQQHRVGKPAILMWRLEGDTLFLDFEEHRQDGVEHRDDGGPARSYFRIVNGKQVLEREEYMRHGSYWRLNSFAYIDYQIGDDGDARAARCRYLFRDGELMYN